MAHYEIEIKSLLGEEKNAIALKEKMCELDPACACVATNKQLNHYFGEGDVNELYTKVEHLLDSEQKEKLKHIVEKGSTFSVRTRQKDDKVLFVVKAAMDEGNAINGVSRMEFEEPVNASLDELDALILETGFVYDSKWSREREEYTYKGANVCIDRNAGYGYLAEFEKMTDEQDQLDVVRNEMQVLLDELGLEELPHDRHDRMYAHYKANWPEYYGTEKTFNIE
ncbi:CYTH domain-containing protein [Candidatus Parcubacteria bacterium]|nr:CYTH domain-containing protein [Candidatus Parcubacteria bacterium]